MSNKKSNFQKSKSKRYRPVVVVDANGFVWRRWVRITTVDRSLDETFKKIVLTSIAQHSI
jgi:hypothetical protein